MIKHPEVSAKNTGTPSVGPQGREQPPSGDPQQPPTHTLGLEPTRLKAAESQVWELHQRQGRGPVPGPATTDQSDKPRGLHLPSVISQGGLSPPCPGRPLPRFKPSEPGTCPRRQLASPLLPPGPAGTGCQTLAQNTLVTAHVHGPNLQPHCHGSWGPSPSSRFQPFITSVSGARSQARPQTVSPSLSQPYPPLLPFPLQSPGWPRLKVTTT